MKKTAKKLCPHDIAKNRDALMFRCRCGNVWIGGKLAGRVPEDQSAVSIFGRFIPAEAIKP